MKIWPNSPVHIPKYDGMLPYANASPNGSASPIAINSVSSTNSPNLKIMDTTSIVSAPVMGSEIDEFVSIINDDPPKNTSNMNINRFIIEYNYYTAGFYTSSSNTMANLSPLNRLFVNICTIFGSRYYEVGSIFIIEKICKNILVD